MVVGWEEVVALDEEGQLGGGWFVVAGGCVRPERWVGWLSVVSEDPDLDLATGPVLLLFLNACCRSTSTRRQATSRGPSLSGRSLRSGRRQLQECPARHIPFSVSLHCCQEAQ